jgi:hypothetical protein
MRALLVLVAACAEPTGLAQTWPPSRGITVEAVVGADLDADGATDVLVFASGNAHQAGIYRVALDRDTVLPIASFVSYTPLALGRPSAGAIATVDGMPDVLAASVVSEVRVDALGALTADDITLTDLPSGNAALWVRALAFPGNMQRIIVSNGTAIEHDSFDTVDAQPLPPPTGPTWSGAATATTFMSASARVLAVATPTQVVTTTLTSTDTSHATWTVLRDGPAWVGQVALDLGGTHEVIAGVDLAAHALCAVDPDSGTPTCLDLGTVSSSGEVGIVELVEPSGIELAIMQADATQTSITLVDHVTLLFGALGGNVSVLAPVAIPHGRPVAVSRFAGSTAAALVFGPDGAVACGAGC